MRCSTRIAPAAILQSMIDCVLAFVKEYAQARAVAIDTYDDHAPDTNNLYGLIYVLNGVRDAVKYLSHLDAVPFGNVTKLEVGHE